MPTVILLDVSMSMCRTSNCGTGKQNPKNESIEIKQLANIGIGSLLDYLAQNAQLEYTALVIFSSLWEVRHQFTRHHESIKNKIYDLELYDKSNIVNAVRGLLSLKLDEWAQNGPLNIILITDGIASHENLKSRSSIKQEPPVQPRDVADFHDTPLHELDGHFNFPCNMQVVCLTHANDSALKRSINFYKDLIAVVDSNANQIPIYTGTVNNKLGDSHSAIWLPCTDAQDLSIDKVEGLFTNIADMHYKPCHVNLTCGHLSSTILLSPRPKGYLVEPLKNEFDDLEREKSAQRTKSTKGFTETYVSAINRSRFYEISDNFNICGFMTMAEVASPAITSRHLVMPIYNNKSDEVLKAEQILSQDPNAYKQTFETGFIMESSETEQAKTKTAHSKSSTDKPRSDTRSALKHATSSSGTGGEHGETDILKQPSFCAMLHNALKQENMVAICLVGKCEATGEDWFGMLHSHTDSKRRSCLMLSVFNPGPAPIHWLPNFKTMGSVQLNADLPETLREKLKNNARPGPARSYMSNNVIWLDPESVQADVQKIVRHAKRGPDKAPHFYKELNRIRRAAISYGFYDVLSGLADILERERRVMLLDQSKSVSQDTLSHIDHVVTSLRASINEDSYDTNIIPRV